jgi:hypothetical protein
MGEYTRLGPRLGAQDRAKLDGHLATLRALEARIAANGARGGGPRCAGAAPPNLSPHSHSSFPEVGKAQTQVLAAALACDLARVASLQWSSARSNITLPWASGGNHNHHDMSHGGANQRLNDINRWYATQLASLATTMKGIPEGDRSLLDNTVIFWCSEVALGANHSFQNLRAVLIGSCGGFFKTGQHVKMGGAPANKLYVTFMNALGIDAQEFGDPKHGAGPLTGLS